ncbi:MAG: hypothetical protein MUC36_24770 [Planctomycetes bacterium]|jgi:hypothetical protein|nr:hypothetical protein [Planctomycetota bacterium]
MSLVLTYCWREWRAQRGMLCAYAVLVFAALVLIALLMPTAWWQQDGRAGVALAAFAIAGGFGVLGFVAAALVRSEFGSKDDQFVLRLPGALLPSFGGKLLFLVLVTAALPVLGLTLGQLLLQAMELETAWPSGAPGGEGSMLSSWPMVWSMWAALGIPWVWAIGTWLPKGRMALGGTVLFVLLLGLLVAAVLRQSPGLEDGIAWRRWVPYVPVLGIAVAFVSWAIGRRGGGPLRSARFGLAASALGLAAPAAWFAVAAWDYHHPDLQRPAQLRVSGLSPDGRYVLASLATHHAYSSVACRVDLQNGSAVKVAGVHGAFTPELNAPFLQLPDATQRLWRWVDYRLRGEPSQHTMFDLATGELLQVASDPSSGQPVLPAAWRALAIAEAAATTPLRGPGDVRFWFEGSELCSQAPNGPVQRAAWSRPLPGGLRAAGHGFECTGPEGGAYDFAQRRFVADAGKLGRVLLVRGRMLVASKQTPSRWLAVDAATREAKPVAALLRAAVLGLLDDDRLLCVRVGSPAEAPPELFTWCPADDAIAAIAVPAGVDWRGGLHVVAPGQLSSLLPRDPRGRCWFATGPYNRPPELLTLDPEARTVTKQPSHLRSPWNWRDQQLLAWSADDTWLLQDGCTIVRLDLATGVRTQLFPQHAEERR